MAQIHLESTRPSATFVHTSLHGAHIPPLFPTPRCDGPVHQQGCWGVAAARLHVHPWIPAHPLNSQGTRGSPSSFTLRSAEAVHEQGFSEPWISPHGESRWDQWTAVRTPRWAEDPPPPGCARGGGRAAQGWPGRAYECETRARRVRAERPSASSPRGGVVAAARTQRRALTSSRYPRLAHCVAGLASVVAGETATTRWTRVRRACAPPALRQGSSSAAATSPPGRGFVK